VNPEDLNQAQYGMLFDVRRSIRYHDRRRAFFDRLHRLTNVLTILLAGGVFFELAGTGSPAVWLQCVGAGAAFLAALDMVVGYSAKSTLHTRLRSRFSDLEIAMLSGDLGPDTWAKYQQQRLQIERDEPPVYRALDLLCFNEQCAAEGASSRAVVSGFQRATSQFYMWSNIGASAKTAKPG
jgi:hypothetical protein